MVTATEESRSSARRIQPSGNRGLAEPKEPKEPPPGGTVVPDKNRHKSKRGKVQNVGTSKLNKDGKRVPPTLKRGDRGRPKLQRLSDEQLVVKPGPSPKQDEVSRMQKIYKRFWAGILSEERIEEECRSIEYLFHA